MGSCIPTEAESENKNEEKKQDDVMENESYEQMNNEFKNQRGDQGLGWEVNAKFVPPSGNQSRGF